MAEHTIYTRPEYASQQVMYLKQVVWLQTAICDRRNAINSLVSVRTDT